eukprot:GILI01019143.1.p1 GENE.GILI01019143.1~~GILI01019143.1.p1  ORF type:complete len:280 (-),score=21.20 GILI01019143.1:42-842(-)
MSFQFDFGDDVLGAEECVAPIAQDLAEPEATTNSSFFDGWGEKQPTSLQIHDSRQMPPPSPITFRQPLSEQPSAGAEIINPSISEQHFDTEQFNNQVQKNECSVPTPNDNVATATPIKPTTNHVVTPLVPTQQNRVRQQLDTACTMARDTIARAKIVADADSRRPLANDANFTSHLCNISHFASKQTDRLEQLSGDYSIKQLGLLSMVGPISENSIISLLGEQSSYRSAPVVHLLPHLLQLLASSLVDLERARDSHASHLEAMSSF